MSDRCLQCLYIVAISIITRSIILLEIIGNILPYIRFLQKKTR